MMGCSLQDIIDMRGAAQDDDLYDAVVIAAPLELAGLQLRGFNVPDIPQRRFKRTVTTIVAGRLRPAYFGVRKLPGTC